ncbi:hypothetical protein F0562_014933 [Nyssa sinensis]|uniref:NAC domain-containing protein n=1 Tax=Nyssa sinensis TaxID=561372 RepID=A0A5J4ZQ38_9ASTE|nr:hypothetical protein F0562_014933 [Nyssa sinensis]
MPQNMSISVNGQSQVPPGFRFHPTEEELLQYYLRKKVSYEKIDLDVIRDVDLNKLEPWDIQGGASIIDQELISTKTRSTPTGTRTNRATTAGFWKATGRDKVIYSNSKRIGMRKTLVFYKGRAPHGQKSDWIMHEYRLDDTNIDTTSNNIVSNALGMGEATQEEGWVVCRIFKKKNHHKTLDSPISTSPMTADTRTQRLMMSSSDEGTLEQILYMGRTCKEEDDEANINSRRFHSPIDTSTVNNGLMIDRFMKLPSLESPNSISCSQACYQQIHVQMLRDINGATMMDQLSGDPNAIGLNDWVAVDQLVASHLNGESETSKQLAACFSDHPDPTMAFTAMATTSHNNNNLGSSSSSSNWSYQATQLDYNNEFGLWSFGQSSSSADPLSLCHMPNAPV